MCMVGLVVAWVIIGVSVRSMIVIGIASFVVRVSVVNPCYLCDYFIAYMYECF